MKKIVVLFLLILAFIPAFGQSGQAHRSVFHLSFVPPLSTHGTQAPQYSNHLSFNILAGVSKNELGFTFAGVTNVITNNAKGLQFAGINNVLGNSGSGFLFSGVSNYVGNNYRGLQFAGAANIVNGNFNGMQFGGVFNFAGSAKGFQFAGVSNVSKGNFSGMQFGGLLNLTGAAKGFQFAGVTNVSGNIRGTQFAGVGNVASNVSGFQFGGVFNIANNVRGAQFAGVINIANSSDYPIGIINIVRLGEKSIGITYNEAGSSVLSFRSGGRVLYGIIGVGLNHKSGDEQYVMEAGFGAHINICRWFRINNELKTNYITSFNSTHINHHSFSILPAFRPARCVEIFAGPAINYMDSDNVVDTKIFPNHSLWKSYGESKIKQLYIGFVVGTHVLF